MRYTTRSLVEFTYDSDDALVAANHHAAIKTWLAVTLAEFLSDAQQGGMPTLHIRNSTTETPMAGDVQSAALPTTQTAAVCGYTACPNYGVDLTDHSDFARAWHRENSAVIPKEWVNKNPPASTVPEGVGQETEGS